MGISGIVSGQNTGTIQRVKAVEAFTKPEKVHLQQNSNGDLWITTPLKVMQYDAAEVFSYNKFRGVPKEIGDEFILSYSDSQGQTWLAGTKGLALFEPSSGEFRHISGVTGNIYRILEDPSQQLWIAAENGIFKLNVTSDKQDFGISRFLSENTVASDVVLSGNQVLFAGPNGMLSIDRKSGKFNKIDMGYYQNLHITKMLPLRDRILIGTRSNGLFSVSPDLKNLTRVYSLPYTASKKEISGLFSLHNKIYVTTVGAGMFVLDTSLRVLEEKGDTGLETIHTAYLSNDNLLWLVTREGLLLSNISGDGVDIQKHDPAVYSSLADDFISVSEIDTEGNIWFGNGKGLSIWNTQTNRWRHIDHLNFSKARNKPDKITALAAMDGHMWIATADDGVYKVNIWNLTRAHYSPEALYKTQIQEARALYVDAKKNVWIGGEDGFLTEISSNNTIKSFPIKNVQAIAELGPKKLIVATGKRVHMLDPATGRITDIEQLYANDSLVYYAMNDLVITREGIGLFATEGAGLIKYDFEKGISELINTENGLPSDNIKSIAISDGRSLWLSTDAGLVFLGEDNKVRIFSEYNGLSSSKLSKGFVWLPDGSLSIGSAKGVNVFRPKAMLAQQSFEPELKLRKILMPGNKKEETEMSISEAEEITLDANSGFQIDFQGYSHLAPQDILYSWKLDGFDEDWTEASPLSNAGYAGLPPGIYNFNVRARLKDSSWGEVVSIPVRVNEVAGTVSTVYVFMGISVVAMVGIFMFVFIKRSRAADEAAREELRKNLQKQFKKPVENAVQSLNKISASAEVGNNEDLQRFAARFDDLFHQILNFNYEGSVYEISNINLSAHLPKVVQELEPVYKSKQIEIIVNDQWGDAEFFYNQEILDKIFFSIVSSSVGYSLQHGKILVNLIQTSIGDLKLQVTDNGSGMNTHDLKVLEGKRNLKPGARLKSSAALRYLLKARDLIAESGGSFSYETEKNEGSTFTVILKNKAEKYRKVPQRAAAIFKSEKAKEQVKQNITPEIKKMGDSKILVIENDPETSRLLVENIGRYCQTFQAKTAEEGLEKAGMVFPDIIISAVSLPDMNGLQLSQMLKRNTALNHVNIFLVSEADQEIAKQQLTEATELIKKPVDMVYLLNKLTEVLLWQKHIKNSYVKALIDREAPEFRSKKDEIFISKLQESVIMNVNNENFGVHELSAEAGITSNELFMKLKAMLDLSPQDFMEFTRLNYARELLESGDYNQMEVAYKSGFSSPKLFQSAFRKYFGYEYNESLKKE